MLKIFENRVCSFIFTLFMLFFVQTVEGNAGFVQNHFQEVGISSTLEKIVATLEKRIVTEAVDKAVIHDVEGQNGLSFVKGIVGKNPGKDPGKDHGKKKGSLFSGFEFDIGKGCAVLLGGACVVGLVASICIGEFVTALASVAGLTALVAHYIPEN
ncbi:hypothetical protein [Bartonella sp. MM73XJBT.G]|uniref:hypothetical protein n=1 Tax=Bartonella sp. MM73XJBT.G TaxID=3019097 RepID=UPI00235EB804|nr:hypothetical protein [Bartonella sp. MM73XJBT.G]